VLAAEDSGQVILIGYNAEIKVGEERGNVVGRRGDGSRVGVGWMGESGRCLLVVVCLL
jgi:hypothetical protein